MDKSIDDKISEYECKFLNIKIMNDGKLKSIIKFLPSKIVAYNGELNIIVDGKSNIDVEMILADSSSNNELNIFNNKE